MPSSAAAMGQQPEVPPALAEQETVDQSLEATKVVDEGLAPDASGTPVAEPAEAPSNLPADVSDVAGAGSTGETVTTHTATPAETLDSVPAAIPTEPVPASASETAPAVVNTAVTEPAANSESSAEPAAEAPQPASDEKLLSDSGTVVAARVTINPEDAGQIWAKVVAEINDMLKSHVKQVSKAAIAAPNKLELTFPRKYHFSKRYCEKPEVISRLEQIAARITGQQLRVSLVVSEDEGPATASQNQKQTAKKPARGRVYKPEDDEFVSTVMQTFDAECVHVNSRAGGGAQSES